MRINRAGLAVQCVEHHAACGLPAHSRKARQVAFNLVVRQRPQLSEVELALTSLDLFQNRSDVVGLGRRQPCVREHTLQLV
jgi:hypothetical protein